MLRAALGNRRIAAVKYLVEERLKAIFKINNVQNELGINIISNPSTGSAGSGVEGADAKNMSLKIVKEERRASINIKKNDKSTDPKQQTVNINQQQNIKKIQDDITATEFLLKQYLNPAFNTRNDAILNGFKSISKNNYYPAFHTQTPEDFHRRLTFLQQCTRQGSAKHFNSEVDAPGTRICRSW